MMQSYESALEQMQAVEQLDGWLADCERRGIYIAITHEFVTALASLLPREAAILEIGSGDGKLATAMLSAGVRVIATDPTPRAPHVLPLTAAEAVHKFSPNFVIACFPPLDAGIEADLFRTRSVDSLLYIGPEWNGRIGPDALWNQNGWTVTSMPLLDQFLISRLDYLADFTAATHQRRAGSLLLKRKESSV